MDYKSFTAKLEDRRQKQADRSATMKLLKKNGQALEVPTGEDPRVPAHHAMEDLLDSAVERGAERVDLQVTQEESAASMMIDGIRYEQPAPEHVIAIAVIDYLKENAGLDLDDRRKKQVGKLFVETEQHGKHELEIITAGSTRGLKLSLRIDPGKRAGIPLTHLGLLDPQKEALLESLDKDGDGVVIVAGPEAQGVTTTLYALLQRHDPYTSSIVTLESEIEHTLEGVSQNQYDKSLKPEQLHEELASHLRADPDVVMLYRVASTETAKLLAQSGEDVRVYLPFRKGDTFSTLQSYLKAVGGKKEAAQDAAGRHGPTPRPPPLRHLQAGVQARPGRAQEAEPPLGSSPGAVPLQRAGDGEGPSRAVPRLFRHRLSRTGGGVRGDGARRRGPRVPRQRGRRASPGPPA